MLEELKRELTQEQIIEELLTHIEEMEELIRVLFQ